MTSPAVNSPNPIQEDHHKDQNAPLDNPDVQNFDPQQRRQNQNRFKRRGGGPGGFNQRFNNPRGRKGFGRPGLNRNEEGGGHEQDNDFNKDSRFQDKLYEKLSQIAGPAVDLPPLDTVEKKFSGRNRLYIGNLSPDVTENDLNELLGKCG
jgi:proline- and glutamine-rich splicing factor